MDDIEEKVFYSSSAIQLEEEIVSVIAQAVSDIIQEKPTKPWNPRKDRTHLKIFWDHGYVNWSDIEFKEHMRVDKATFDLILNRINASIYKTPTNMEQNPLESHRQLALTFYILGHGCFFRVVSDLFGVSIASAFATFKKIIREMISHLFNDYVHMPTSEVDWMAECKGFIENYEFLRVGAWDGFHVHVSTHLKNYYSFKNRYTITDMGLIGYNKRFLALTAVAPGSTHDARLLRCTKVSKDVIAGNAIPDRALNLGDEFGEIPLVTIGDSAFPRFAWLLEMFNENTQDPKQRYYNKNLCSARVVAENCYGMLKGSFRIICKRC